ncbi:MAG: ATP-binding cassette domain-containing protein [Acidimicrobiia bacterium]|nr:ATP-binding cassette domain-containing protein [Acidimicrobiia bacterium]
MSGPGVRSFARDRSVAQHRLAPGTLRRIAGFARPYRGKLAVFLALILLDSLLGVAAPLVYRSIIDDGIAHDRRGLVVGLAVLVAALATVSAVASLAQRWYSARIGEGLVYDLRTRVFDHVQRMPVAFFTRTQTGALVTRLDGDVQGAQQAFTSTLSNVVGNLASVVATIVAMAVLSWQITLLALVLLPLFVLPARLLGPRLQRITRERYQLNAVMGQTMNERFNVSGALVVKLFGVPERESAGFAASAGRVRDIGVTAAMYTRVFMTGLTLVAALATALVYGLGGSLAISGSLGIGTLVALTAYLGRLYGPLTSLSNLQVDVMTTLVSFERVLEVLDLEPSVADAPGARALERGASSITFEGVSFRYPAASEVSLASLESVAQLSQGAGADVLREVSFAVPPGHLTALVGPSGAGKTTVTGLVTRLFDATSGVVRVGGQDVRDVTQQSLRDAIGVVSQDAHLFHDTLRANLLYAKPDATEAELVAALQAAYVWDVVAALPEGLDTVVGDRGHRLSGGEKQRLAIARVLLKSPAVVVLDEATAHLDSESEAAVQRALGTALARRTSLVIAHRLSTVRHADEILVLDAGRIVERGTHAELVARGGLYAELSRTQFVEGAEPAGEPATATG